jgi:hypothetical protein
METILVAATGAVKKSATAQIGTRCRRSDGVSENAERF